MTEPPDERAERALRTALAGADVGDAVVDPVAARHRARARRWLGLAGVGVTVLALVVLGAVLVPSWWRGRTADPTAPTVAAPPAAPATGYTDPAPAGWRTEQYRGISFQVPAAWGYAYEPGSAWCADPRAEPGATTPEPYVALGTPSITPAIGCTTPMPDRLVTEHVQAAVVDQAGPGTSRVNGLWVIIRVVDGVQVKAVSRDRSRAQRIVDSAQTSTPDAACAPTMTTRVSDRPDPAFSVADVEPTGAGVVCQYEDPTGTATTAALRARTVLGSTPLRALTRDVGRSEPVPPCGAAVVEPSTELLLIVRIPTSTGVRDLVVRAGSCGDADGHTFGGFDDGTTVHRLVRSTCQRVMVEPVDLLGGSGDVATACLPR